MKIDVNDLDQFVRTLLTDHVDPSAQQLIWNSYEEFKLNYESIIIEDPKEETTAKLKTYAEKVDKVFKKLKARAN